MDLEKEESKVIHNITDSIISTGKNIPKYIRFEERIYKVVEENEINQLKLSEFGKISL